MFAVCREDVNVHVCCNYECQSFMCLNEVFVQCESRLMSSWCYVDDKVSKVAWLNRSNIIFAGEDKWSLDPRVELVTQGQLEYSLRIQKVDVFDEGPYTCSIQTKQQPKTSQVYLIVQVPAIIYKVSEDITVNEGSNVTLTCLANGRPDPSITWRLLNPSAEALDVGEYLEISGIVRSQAGRYECKASNDVSTPDVKYVNVVVNYPPYIKEVRSSETPVGQAGILHCEASAVPQPEFEWYRDERRLSSSQSVSIQISGARTLLVVANVTEDDYGNYTCVATNRLGIHNASVFLYMLMFSGRSSQTVSIRHPRSTLRPGRTTVLLSGEKYDMEKRKKSQVPPICVAPPTKPHPCHRPHQAQTDLQVLLQGSCVRGKPPEVLILEGNL
ncbi:Limbic system-associated membrane protein [Anabarilius grahami]|uniref:Limbic system-associated membrane protein n=1 Tax=Anabarilius grahami TaxID=495550 RepID=A0A3N0Z8N2_ANAGA|nr:Limbic system-associated membrane protein [Anabarilius grahami]